MKEIELNFSKKRQVRKDRPRAYLKIAEIYPLFLHTFFIFLARSLLEISQHDRDNLETFRSSHTRAIGGSCLIFSHDVVRVPLLLAWILRTRMARSRDGIFPPAIHESAR